MSTSDYSARTPDDYLRTRVDFKTEAYRRKGEHYRWSYLLTASAAAVAAAAVPVLINLKQIPSIVPTLLSLFVTILVSLEGIFHLREHWKNYDLMKSFLREEACLFQAGAGPYRGKASAKAFMLFVERVEDGIAKQRAQTIEMRTSRAPDDHDTSTGGAKPTLSPPASDQKNTQPLAPPDAV